MPFINRFLLNDNGAIIFTGNTRGLSRSNTVAVSGTLVSSNKRIQIIIHLMAHISL